MSEKKETRAGTAIPTRVVENGSVCETAQPSMSNDTISTPPGQAGIISRLLSHGADHRLHLSDLVRLTGLSEWNVRRQIEVERRSGALIISDNRRGYWIANDPAEAQQFARSMRHRALEILRTARAIKGAAGIGE